MEPTERSATIRRARLAGGLTQKQLAGRAGIAQPNLAAYESGRRAVSEEVAEKLIHSARPRPSVALWKHADEVRRIALRHGVTRVRVFGSVARGDDRFNSDVDLLVQLRPETSLFDLVEMTAEIEALLGCPIDLISEAGLGDRDAHLLAEAVPL